MADVPIELIARLEAATDGSEELDQDISAVIVGATLDVQPDGRRAWHRDGHWVSIQPVKPYTTSIDAAVTLVPDVRDWTLTQRLRHPFHGRFTFEATIWPTKNSEQRPVQGFSFTPDIALCVAALKARADG